MILLAHIKLTLMNRTLVKAYNEMHRNYQRSLASKVEDLASDKLEGPEVPETATRAPEVPEKGPIAAWTDKPLRSNINGVLQKFYAVEPDRRPEIFAAVKDHVHGHHFELLWRATSEESIKGPHMAAHIQEFLLTCSQDALDAFANSVDAIKADFKLSRALKVLQPSEAPLEASAKPESAVDLVVERPAERPAGLVAERPPERPADLVAEQDSPATVVKPKKKKASKQTVIID